MKTRKILSLLLCVGLIACLSACAKNLPNYIENCYEYKLEDYITLGEYKGFVIEVDKPVATEAEIKESFDLFLADYTKYVATDRTFVQDGDQVDVSFVGYMDGVQQASMTGTKKDLIIGSHSFIDTFEEQLIGVSIGQTVRITVTFPSYYPSKPEYQDKPGVFDVTINGILAKEAPELTDEFIKEKTDYPDVESYRKHIVEAIEKSKAEQNEEDYINGIWTKIVNGITIKKYPNGLVDKFAKESKESIEYLAKQYYGFSLEQYVSSVGMTMEEFEAYNTNNAQQVVRNRLIIYAICAAENISIEKEEYEKLGAEYARDAGVASLEELEKKYTREEIVTDMASNKVYALLKESSTMKIKE